MRALHPSPTAATHTALPARKNVRAAPPRRPHQSVARLAQVHELEEKQALSEHERGVQAAKVAEVEGQIRKHKAETDLKLEKLKSDATKKDLVRGKEIAALQKRMSKHDFD